MALVLSPGSLYINQINWSTIWSREFRSRSVVKLRVQYRLKSRGSPKANPPLPPPLPPTQSGIKSRSPPPSPHHPRRDPPPRPSTGRVGAAVDDDPAVAVAVAVAVRRPPVDQRPRRARRPRRSNPVRAPIKNAPDGQRSSLGHRIRRCEDAPHAADPPRPASGGTPPPPATSLGAFIVRERNSSDSDIGTPDRIPRRPVLKSRGGGGGGGGARGATSSIGAPRTKDDRTGHRPSSSPYIHILVGRFPLTKIILDTSSNQIQGRRTGIFFVATQHHQLNCFNRG